MRRGPPSFRRAERGPTAAVMRAPGPASPHSTPMTPASVPGRTASSCLATANGTRPASSVTRRLPDPAARDHVAGIAVARAVQAKPYGRTDPQRVRAARQVVLDAGAGRLTPPVTAPARCRTRAPRRRPGCNRPRSQATGPPGCCRPSREGLLANVTRNGRCHLCEGLCLCRHDGHSRRKA
jgi:hypothetical protein